MVKRRVILPMCGFLLFHCGTTTTRVHGQDASDDTVRVSTRVVFIETLVKNKQTNGPVRGLARDDFQVFDDGRPRTLSYFGREGDTRRPLALVLFVDLWATYGRQYLKKPDAMRRLAAALTKLAPEDEVAVMVTWLEEGGQPGTILPTWKTIGGFTPDRAKTTRALLTVPELIKQQDRLLKELEKRSQELGDSMIDVGWNLSNIADAIIPLGTGGRPSQVVVVGLLDDLFHPTANHREEAAEKALRADVIFNGLVFKKSFFTKMLMGTINKVSATPIAVQAADYLAGQTGGQIASVGRAEDLAIGFERFISSLMARYSLGFQLDEGERDDGRMHQLEVRVKAADELGKKRKLVVSARRGYYVPKAKEVRAVK